MFTCRVKRVRFSLRHPDKVPQIRQGDAPKKDRTKLIQTQLKQKPHAHLFGCPAPAPLCGRAPSSSPAGCRPVPKRCLFCWVGPQLISETVPINLQENHKLIVLKLSRVITQLLRDAAGADLLGMIGMWHHHQYTCKKPTRASRQID